MENVVPMEVVLSALTIFCLRIADVSIGTIRLLYMVRGQRLITAVLAFFEISIWLIATALVFQKLDQVWNMVAFAAGFATGNAVGMTIERIIGSGYVLLRIISRENGLTLLHELRDRGFGLTTVYGEGREGQVMVLIAVVQRRRADQALKVVQELDPKAFITIENVSRAAGGYVPSMPAPIPKVPLTTIRQVCAVGPPSYVVRFFRKLLVQFNGLLARKPANRGLEEGVVRHLDHPLVVIPERREEQVEVHDLPLHGDSGNLDNITGFEGPGEDEHERAKDIA